MSYIDISRYAAFGLAAVAGLSVAATDPGITLVAGEAQSRQVADTTVADPSFSYRVDGGVPTVKVRTRDFLFCANSGDLSMSVPGTHLDVQREGFVFGAFKKSGAATVVNDVRDFSYGRGGPVVRVSAAAPGASVPGTLVCLSMDSNGQRHHVGSGLFADPFESPYACSEQTAGSCSNAFNSSVSISTPHFESTTVGDQYMEYFVTVNFTQIPQGPAAKLVLRDGYLESGFSDAQWCQVDTHVTSAMSVSAFDPAQDCLPGSSYTTTTIDHDFSITEDGEQVFFVRRKTETLGLGNSETPVIAAALFPDPAVEEMRTDDNVAAYPSTPEQVTEFQQLLEDARIHMEAQSTWQ